MVMPLRTKRVYDDASPDDGYRLLVMRYWPRGISKEDTSDWERSLAPSPQLLKQFQSQAITWEQYAKGYLGEISANEEAQVQLRVIRTLAGNRTVTLMCGCKDETRCHRTLLKALVEDGE